MAIGDFTTSKKSEKVLNQTVGQFGFQKVAENHIVVGIGQGYLIQVVSLHEFIEHIRTQYYRFGYGNAGIFQIRRIPDDVLPCCQ